MVAATRAPGSTDDNVGNGDGDGTDLLIPSSMMEWDMALSTVIILDAVLTMTMAMYTAIVTLI